MINVTNFLTEYSFSIRFHVNIVLYCTPFIVSCFYVPILFPCQFLSIFQPLVSMVSYIAMEWTYIILHDVWIGCRIQLQHMHASAPLWANRKVCFELAQNHWINNKLTSKFKCHTHITIISTKYTCHPIPKTWIIQCFINEKAEMRVKISKMTRMA